MFKNDNPYMPIALSLRVAIEQNDYARNQNVRIMVKEAKMLQQGEITVHTLSRSIYTYATAINRYKPSLVRDMVPECLGEAQYRQLLEFFESL